MRVQPAGGQAADRAPGPAAAGLPGIAVLAVVKDRTADRDRAATL